LRGRDRTSTRQVQVVVLRPSDPRRAVRHSQGSPVRDAEMPPLPSSAAAASPLLHLSALRAALAAHPRSRFVSARLPRSGAPAPTLVLDLDETLLFRTRGLLDAALLYAAPAALSAGALRVGEPYAAAAGAVRDLARRFRVVAVTARFSSAARATELWLAAHGLEGLPVVLARDMHPRDASRVAYKRAAIRLLREEGWAPVLGVGDRPSDLAAYAGEGLAAVMVAHARGAAPGSAARHLAELAALEGRLWREAVAAAAPPPPPVYYVSDCAALHAGARAGGAEAGASADARGAPRDGSVPALFPAESSAALGVTPAWLQIRALIEGRAGELGGGDGTEGAAEWGEEAGSYVDAGTAAALRR